MSDRSSHLFILSCVSVMSDAQTAASFHKYRALLMSCGVTPDRSCAVNQSVVYCCVSVMSDAQTASSFHKYRALLMSCGVTPDRSSQSVVFCCVSVMSDAQTASSFHTALYMTLKAILKFSHDLETIFIYLNHKQLKNIN